MSTSLPAPQDAAHGLYRDHRGWLDGWLRRKLGNACDAADLVQDTFVRVLRHRAELAMVREPRAYLTTIRSEEHTSELQSLMRISYAVFCLKKKKTKKKLTSTESMNKTINNTY